MKNQIEVILSPLLLPNFTLEGKVVVVIDILRATSTISAAIFNGAHSVIPVVSTEEALGYDRNEFLIAGEREGQKAPGFDFGNSPLEYRSEVVKNREVVLTTTNGTRCIHASSDADAADILVGAFTNASATNNYLRTCGKDVVLFCSGWKNRVNLEDTLYAGSVIHALQDVFDVQDDSAELAHDLYQCAKDNLLSYLKKASHPRRFERLGNTTDLPHCLQTDIYNIAIGYRAGKLIRL
ncbi:MAG: 2-phosphosulfolactate phosphatase [Flavobacteriales bacterium]|nr:2-phosphosulfolactate phosphatase [Flavobacteriales bacterium]